MRGRLCGALHSSFPGLLKTAFRLLGMPPLNLFDAAAADLSECFGGTADFRPYEAVGVAAALFDPAKAKDPLDPAPGSPRMDDPKFPAEQHEAMRKK